jgi:CRP-like cAMP-binding protein
MLKIHDNSRRARFTPSPSKSSYSSNPRNYGSKSREYPPIYPSWLLQRPDFQEIFDEYESIEKIELISIFQKDHSIRKDFENHAIDLFIQSTHFFNDIINAKSLLKKFQPEFYEEGENLYESNQKKVFIILKGELILDNEVKLGRNNPVGEFQITENKNLDIIACRKSSVLSISEADYKTLFMHVRLRQLKQYIPMLSQFSCFSHIKPIRIEKIASTCMVIQYDKDQEVYSMGDASNYMYLVIQGKIELSSEVKITSTNNLPIGFKKREKLIIEKQYFHPVASIEENENCGIIECAHGTVRKTSAKTTKPTTLLALKWSEVLDIITETEKNKIISLLARFNSKTLEKAVKSKIIKNKMHISALMQASQIKNTPSGRDMFEEYSRRKREYSKVLYDKHNYYVNENLISKSYSFRDVVLPKIKHIH